MSALAESTNMNRVMYREWYPQIMYNHHQTGPQGTVMFAPPFRDPFNYNLHPYDSAGIDLVGATMMERFLSEGKPGVTQRRGAPYSTWFNGGIRTTAHFHNMIGILTETIGTPSRSRFRSCRQAAARLEPVVADRAAEGMAHAPVDRVLDDGQPRDPRLRVALPRARALQHLPDGKDAIQWGSEDHWTFTPQKWPVRKGSSPPDDHGHRDPGAAST